MVADMVAFVASQSTTSTWDVGAQELCSVDGSSQKAKQKRLISIISLFSRLSRPEEAALGFVGTALLRLFHFRCLSPYIFKNNKSQVVKQH